MLIIKEYLHYEDEDCNTGLHHAAMNGHLNVVQYLTANDVNPAIPGQGGVTPLRFASMCGHLNVVRFLIDEQNADPWCLNQTFFSWLVHMVNY